jgi:diguanylate cyclase (GGDEF)-like protein
MFPKWPLVFTLLCLSFGNAVSSQAQGPEHPQAQVLTTVAQIRAVPKNLARQGLPVALHATLTYYQPKDRLVFAEDSTGGIFVMAPPHAPELHAGDEVLLEGTTTMPGFATNVQASQIRFEHAGRLPRPRPVTWTQLMHGAEDCAFVSLIGTVRSASVQFKDDPGSQGPRDNSTRLRQYLLMDLQTAGGIVRVHMEDRDGIEPMDLLDDQVKLEGVAGGIFDGRYRQMGAELWMSSARQLTILDTADTDPADLPVTPINKIMSGYFAHDASQRVHVRGSVTLYQPGLQMVLETPDGQAALVTTYEQSPLHTGQVVDAVGFPDPREYSEMLANASVAPTKKTQTIEPVPIQWTDALAGHYPFDLVSMQGQLAAEVHEAHQDTLVIEAGGHVFSAILSRTVWNRGVDEIALPNYPVGSTVRITGVCFVHAGGPWNTERWFDLQLRSPEDVAVLVPPPWWTVRRLLYLSAAMLALMVAAFVWVVVLQRKVRKQSEQLRLTMESEANRERRIAFLEKERGRVLEAINSMLNLDDVLLMILRLISTQLEGRTCWSELANGTIVGEPGSPKDLDRAVRRGIYSSAGERLGALVVSGAEAFEEQAGEALELGASLAALAIDNRRLYETLIHRSQYDQLTNVANRFLLESRLEEALAHAERTQSHFALVYIDLDQFKQINDLYGHRVGDVFLQQVAERFSEKLRGMDTLARVGGDEFIALIPVVRNRAEVEEIVGRLTHCFDTPFRIEDYSVRGGASIGIAVYPEDGATRDELKRVADTAMYANKPRPVG